MVWEGGARWRDDSENFYFSINRVKDGSCVSTFKMRGKRCGHDSFDLFKHSFLRKFILYS